MLTAQSWSGNVRELCDVLERGAILAEADVLVPEQVSGDASVPRAVAPSVAALPDGSLDELERRAILQAIELEDGNRKRPAARLETGLRTLYEKLKAYGINE